MVEGGLEGWPVPQLTPGAPARSSQACFLGPWQCGLFTTRGRQRATQQGWGSRCPGEAVFYRQANRLREAMRPS